jgi:hypothetical protein
VKELAVIIAALTLLAGAFILGESVGEEKARKLDAFELRWTTAHEDGGR